MSFDGVTFGGAISKFRKAPGNSWKGLAAHVMFASLLWSDVRSVRDAYQFDKHLNPDNDQAASSEHMAVGCGRKRDV